MWIALGDIDIQERQRHGNKAVELARAKQEGLPVPASWVLPASKLAALATDDRAADQAAADLVKHLPGPGPLLLRSSSPLEDLPAASAAGLFPTLSCAARKDAIARGLQKLARSVDDPFLRRWVGAAEGKDLPLAVLAQRRLELEAWCTVQGAAGAPLLVEGWRRTARGREVLWLRVDAKTPEVGGEIADLLALARDAIAGRHGNWLLEIGVEAGRALLLQRRPVRRPAPLPPREEPPLLDFPLFPGDEQQSWRWDAEHSPTPLCPLLAGLFLRWIRAQGPGHPSRLIDGRWHDRVEALADDAPAEEIVRELRAEVDAWDRQHLPRLRQGLEELQERFDPLPSPGDWMAFTGQWLSWQTLYYSGASGRLRRLAHRILDTGRQEGEAPPPLPETLAVRRARELDALARFWARHLDPAAREEALDRFLARHGHHAPGGWDGRAIPWNEDPAPLIAELKRRMEELRGSGPPDSFPAPGPGRSPGPDAAAGTRERPGPKERPMEPRATAWAVQALARLEDDDELLSSAYALLRSNALQLQAWLRPEAEGDEILSILPEDLEALLPAPEAPAWERAVARGRSLQRRWEHSFARRDEAQALPEAGTGESLPAVPLSGGVAEGPMRRLDSAQAEGGPARGEILVVPSITPADAVVFDRCAGLVCESGDLLGHAAVLARERGLPAVVLPGARRRLAAAHRLRVDGTCGVVKILLLALLLLAPGPIRLPAHRSFAATAGTSPGEGPEALRLDAAAARIDQDLRALCGGLPRVPGSAGYRDAWNWTRKRLEEVGLHLRSQRVSVHRWDAGRLAVRWTDTTAAHPLRLYAMGRSRALRSGSYRLLEVGHGRPEEIAAVRLLAPGRILVAREEVLPGLRPVHRLEKTAAAAAAGAAGILFVHPGGERVEGVVAWRGRSAVPAYGMEGGRGLLEALSKGSPVELQTLDEGFRPPALVEVESVNGLADLRPPGPTEEVILVCAHLDGWSVGPGALDNAAGVAVLLECARRLAGDPRLRGPAFRPLRFVLFTGEELGLEGSRAYLEAAENGEEAWPALVVNLEMPADPAGFVIHLGAALRAPLRQVLLQQRSFRLDAGVEEICDLYSDHMPFVLEGVPSFTLADHRDPGAMERIHTSLDRPEALDPMGLARAAVLLSSALRAMADPATPLPPRLDEASLRRWFQRSGLQLDRVRRRGF